MKTNSNFNIKKVQRTSKPAFPTRSSAIKFLTLGAASLTFAAAGCHFVFEEDTCEEPGFSCATPHVGEFCNENLERTIVNCWDYCENGYDIVLDATCTGNAENPCSCRYDTIDGMIGECYDGDFYCLEDGISWCEATGGDYGYYETRSCQDHCTEEFGPEFVSHGACSNENPENPCNCEYDIIDGDMPACTPGEFYCTEAGIEWCVPGGYGYFETRTCTDHCKVEFGDEFVSYGDCSLDNPENPCNCDYDGIDGGMPACTPGDMYCADDATLAVCQDNAYEYVMVDCNDKCLADFGAGFVSEGCFSAVSDNPCGCTNEQ
ncbi:hypothetical protein KKF34_11000 [Myxococcota bacterium]|nr:hypothetical protein [Myxococcota bacterium]MBU1379922.1 hypothetical protein [Myxococcota bacterium]MBU1497393.1 hypothetical protein [Myxococcota bacterium]